MQAKQFVGILQAFVIDISVKTGAPSAALTKLPLAAGYEVVDFVVARMASALFPSASCNFWRVDV